MDLHLASWNCERLSHYIVSKPAQLSFGDDALPLAGPTLADVFTSLGRPHVVCLQEVRLRKGDGALVARARQAVPGYRAFFHLCDDARNAASAGGRHYGVATYVRDEVGPVQARTLEWDHEGRILFTYLEAARLTVVNWYGVNGTDRPHYDREAGDWGGDRHGFKLRSQERLLRACEPHAGERLIVIGDANVTPTADDITPRLRRSPPHVAARSHLNDVFKPGLKLVDVYRQLHPEARQYTWFNRVALARGKVDAARVDYALVSEDLLPHVHGATVDDAPAARFCSDHAPIHVTLSV
jgi:exodeoxyribonuclease III